MKTLGFLLLLSTTAMATETTPAKHKTHRDPASVKPGHYACAEPGADIADVQAFLEANCDTSKSFSMSVYSSGNYYSNYGACCIHK